MTDDTPPPSPLPPAAQSPYPAQPAPRAHGEAPLPPTPKPAAKAPVVPGFGAFGLTLLGGALAAAVGAMVVRPLLKRGKAAPAKRPARKPVARAKATRAKKAKD